MKPKNKNLETLQAILIAIFAALILRQFVIAAYKIPTSSMEDTLLVGDFLLVNKFVYGARTPDWIGIPFTRVGFNIVVFKYPRDPHLEYIKRCVAVGGQTVEVINKDLYVDGKRFPDPPHLKHIDPYTYSREQNYFGTFQPGLGSRDNFGPYKVPFHYYFMMGDNRDNSSDSREWGPVPPRNIVGKPLIIYLSWDSEVPGYRILHKIRWNRLGSIIR